MAALFHELLIQDEHRRPRSGPLSLLRSLPARFRAANPLPVSLHDAPEMPEETLLRAVYYRVTGHQLHMSEMGPIGGPRGAAGQRLDSHHGPRRSSTSTTPRSPSRRPTWPEELAFASVRGPGESGPSTERGSRRTRAPWDGGTGSTRASLEEVTRAASERERGTLREMPDRDGGSHRDMDGRASGTLRLMSEVGRADSRTTPERQRGGASVASRGERRGGRVLSEADVNRLIAHLGRQNRVSVGIDPQATAENRGRNGRPPTQRRPLLEPTDSSPGLSSDASVVRGEVLGSSWGSVGSLSLDSTPRNGGHRTDPDGDPTTP